MVIINIGWLTREGTFISQILVSEYLCCYFLLNSVACCADCSVSLVERVDRSCVWVYNKAGQVINLNLCHQFSVIPYCPENVFQYVIRSVCLSLHQIPMLFLCKVRSTCGDLVSRTFSPKIFCSACIPFF